MQNQAAILDLPWLSIIPVAIMALCSIPYWAARSAETDELLFRRIYFDEVDYSVHISMLRAGRMGDWVHQIRFTSGKHQASFQRRSISSLDILASG